MAVKPKSKRASVLQTGIANAPPVAPTPPVPPTPVSPPASTDPPGTYDDQTGLILPRTSPATATDFPQFGQLSRSGLLAAGGLIGSANYLQAQRVYNPERISMQEFDEMSLDPVIRACLLGYSLILQTADLSVHCADASMKALIEQLFLPLMPKLIREAYRPAMVFGWSDSEIVWGTRYNVSVEVDAGETNATVTAGPDGDPGDQPVRIFPVVTSITDIVPLNNMTVTLRQTLRGEFAGLVQWGWGEVFLSPSKLFHFPRNSLFRNPYGESAIKACYPFWYWTRFLYEMLMVAIERGAAPPIIGYYPPGMPISVGSGVNGVEQQTDAGDYMMQQVTQLRSFSTAVIPSLLDRNGNPLYKIEELELDAHVDWMLQSIETLNAQKQLAMFFPDKLLQGGDIGSYALAKEQTDLFSLAVKANLDELLDYIIHGPLRQFVHYNDPNCPPATLTYAAPNIQAMQALAQAAIGSITSGQALVTQNQDKILVPDWQKLADDLGIPYSIVRATDGMDALGNPLQSGADPDAQDHQSAINAGYAQGTPMQSGGMPGGDGPSGPQAPPGQSPDDYLTQVLGSRYQPSAQVGQ